MTSLCYCSALDCRLTTQCQVWALLHGEGLKSKQRVVGCSDSICVTIALWASLCRACCYDCRVHIWVRLMIALLIHYQSYKPPISWELARRDDTFMLEPAWFFYVLCFMYVASCNSIHKTCAGPSHTKSQKED